MQEAVEYKRQFRRQKTIGQTLEQQVRLFEPLTPVPAAEGDQRRRRSTMLAGFNSATPVHTKVFFNLRPQT